MPPSGSRLRTLTIRTLAAELRRRAFASAELSPVLAANLPQAGRVDSGAANKKRRAHFESSEIMPNLGTETLNLRERMAISEYRPSVPGAKSGPPGSTIHKLNAHSLGRQADGLAA